MDILINLVKDLNESIYWFCIRLLEIMIISRSEFILFYQILYLLKRKQIIKNLKINLFTKLDIILREIKIIAG